MKSKKWIYKLSLTLILLIQNVFGGTPLEQSAHDFVIPEYTFRNGQKLKDLKIHYVTLGTPRTDNDGNISNAVLHTLETWIKRVKHGKAVIQAGTPDSFGHLQADIR